MATAKSNTAANRLRFYRALRRIAGPVTAYRLANGVMTCINEAKPLAVVSAGAVAIHAVFVGMGGI